MHITTILLALLGCMRLHSVQIGEVSTATVQDGERFEIKLSAVGFSTREMGEIAKMAASTKRERDTADSISAIVELFQMGPRTGDTVADPRFSDRLITEVRKRCPSGAVSGLMTVRETADYPGITGEIVKLVGYCGGNK
jgi:hypothetical protein